MTRSRFKARSRRPRTHKVISPTRENRLLQLREKVPELFTPPTRKVLYIGASRRAHCLTVLHQAGHEITLLEIHPPNVAEHQRDERLEFLICGDVRYIEKILSLQPHYDVVFWWHGPEHIECEDVDPTLEKLEGIADWVILACPWGKYRQNKTGGNPYEEHRCHLYPATFKARGYETATLGRKDRPGSNLLAWRVT